MALPSFSLQNGNVMPALGFGAGTKWYKEDEKSPLNQELVEMIKTAISRGFTHIDGAEAYGTEAEIGAAIKDSGVQRETIFVTSKVQDSIENIPAAIEASLKKLNLEYVDLYLIHSPYFTDDESKLQQAWKEMENVSRSGKAKAIGVSNFLRPHIEAILKTATIPPAVNQIEFHPYLQRANGYVPWLQSNGIQVSGFKPLTPFTAVKDSPLDPVVEKIAKSHGVSQDAVLLKWQIQQKIAPITTSSHPDRLDEYMQVTQFELAEDELKEITDVGSTYHFRNWGKKRFAPDDRT